MRQTQTTTSNVSMHRRQSTGEGLTFGRLIAYLTMGIVLVLAGATFLGDYLRVPHLSAGTFPGIISPNGDQTQDTVTFNYTLSDVADVEVVVLTTANTPIKTLSTVTDQPAGQYVLVWDGTDDRGQVVNDGRYQIQVVAKGTSRSISQNAAVEVDTRPPTLKLTNLDDINRVADAALTIEGVTEVGSTVYQAGNAQVVPVDAQGFFKIERRLTEGLNILEVLASDQAGNTTRTSHQVTLVTQPPQLTIVAPLNDQWLNESVFEVIGTVPEGASVKVNDQQATVQEDGTFRREVILQEGDNTIRVEATDDVGNITSLDKVIHLKTRPPVLSVNLDEGTTFQQSTVQLTGRTDPGSTVLVNNQVLTVSPLGEFQRTLNLLNGVNVIEIESRDVAGNISTLTRRVNFASPVYQNEITRFLNSFPPIPSLGTPLMILLPTLLLLGYLFTRPVSLILTAETDTFTPGLPEEGKVIALTLQLSRSSRTTVEVLNQFNRPVVTISHRRQREAGRHTFYWDGYDDVGQVLAPGDYTLQATAGTPGGTVSSAVLLTIREDPVVHSQYRVRQETVPAQAPAQMVRRERRNHR